MDSPTLGYVDATHQSLHSHVDKTVWTFYWARSEGTSSDNRELLLNCDWNYWKDAILHDLETRASKCQKVRFANRYNAHGTRHGPPRSGSHFFRRARNLAQGRGRILFANSDLSGFSIFEEAQYRGVTAAGLAHA